MPQLVLIATLSFLLRWADQSLPQAALATCMLAVTMVPCFKWGGWESPAGALTWARQQTLVSVLASFVVATMFVLGLWSGLHPLGLLISECISAYFFLHAFGSFGEWVLEPRRSN